MVPSAVYFDMDGTLADLFGYPHWLDLLHAEDVRPYAEAAPLHDMTLLNDLVALLQSMDVTVGVVSWASMGSSKAYKEAVARAKREWLSKYLPAIKEVHVVAYGVPKQKASRVKRDCVLVDDSAEVRKAWDSEGRTSIDPAQCVEFMASIAREAVRLYNEGK